MEAEDEMMMDEAHSNYTSCKNSGRVTGALQENYDEEGEGYEEEEPLGEVIDESEMVCAIRPI